MKLAKSFVLFKSFENKLGFAYNNAKMAASTSIDHLSGAARASTTNGPHGTGGSQATTPRSETAAPLS